MGMDGEANLPFGSAVQALNCWAIWPSPQTINSLIAQTSLLLLGKKNPRYNFNRSLKYNTKLSLKVFFSDLLCLILGKWHSIAVQIFNFGTRQGFKVFGLYHSVILDRSMLLHLFLVLKKIVYINCLMCCLVHNAYI